MQKLVLFLIVWMTMSTEAMVISVTGNIYDESGNALVGVSISEKGTTNVVLSDVNGAYTISVKDTKSKLIFSLSGFEKATEAVGSRQKIDVILKPVAVLYEQEVLEEHYAPQMDIRSKLNATGAVSRSVCGYPMGGEVEYNTEEYDAVEENIFHTVTSKPLSTFSIDVDAASYSNLRRFLNSGQRPPQDAVRVEEMINYFTYDYKQPTGNDPFSIETNYMATPWNDQHYLVQIGLQGKEIKTDNLPASNLVFLIDVSGSMDQHNKLPLLKSAFKMLVNELRPADRVSIVVYAGAAGLVLPPTNGSEKNTIIAALEQLQAGGSTAGGAGIQLAYKIAKEQFIKGGNNRVILATDGDFNVGASSNADMESLIVSKRDEGIFLTVLGFGMGNYKDSKMETLADKGNGNYAYIDTMQEAKKVLVTEFGGTLFTIAKDVKIQVEFNPAVVQAYRLIGYENRKLNDEDFNDDKKDAGELGSGHTVTALYEVIPVGVKSSFVKDIDPLKYQPNEPPVTKTTDELLTVKFRYKDPDGDTSKLISKTLTVGQKEESNPNLNWASAVAGFGMILSDSEFKGDLTYEKVLELARKSKGADDYGYRAEFIRLVTLASAMP